MPSRPILFLVVALGASAPAGAAVTVIGSNAARLCYEAAESPLMPSASDIRECDTALKRDPLSEEEVVATHVNRGILKLRRGAMEAAVADFDEAIRRDPNEPEAWLNKGLAFVRAPGRTEEALPLLDAAIAKGTSEPAIAHYARAVVHELAGRLEPAWRDYQAAVRHDPEWKEAKADLARFSVAKK